MGAMPDYFDNALPTEQSLDLGFSVVSQKVDLTVHFAAQVVSGTTEITIQPEVKAATSQNAHATPQYRQRCCIGVI